MALPMEDCVIMMGDSLTQRMDSPGNLHQRMAEAYVRKLDVLNRGYGGFNSEWYRPLIDKILVKKGEDANCQVVRLVTIWLGTNDSTIGRDQTLPLPRFKDNINYILENLTSPSSPYAVSDTPVSVILITPGPALISQMAPDRQKFRTLEQHRAYKNAILEIGEVWKAKEKEMEKGLEEGRYGWKIAVANIWDEIVKEAGGEGEELAPFYIDGVHLATKGYTAVWNTIAKTIKTEFGGRGLDWEDLQDLPRRVPHFSDIHFDDPQTVVDLMALPKIRGGSGPKSLAHKNEKKAFEG